MKILGENTPEEMALPPKDRTIKIGTKLNTSALELALARFAPAIGDDEP